MLAFLDRGNIGNARIAGMAAELNLDSERYSWLLNIFYITYVVFEFAVLLYKVFPPHIVVALVVFGWYVIARCAVSISGLVWLTCLAFRGLISTVQAGAQSWGGMMALRFLLGAFEAAYGCVELFPLKTGLIGLHRC
jgi:hypothetical protein